VFLQPTEAGIVASSKSIEHWVGAPALILQTEHFGVIQ